MNKLYTGYGFDETVSYTSKVEQAGFEYPSAPAPQKRNVFCTFKHDGYMPEAPLCQPIFEGVLTKAINFVGDVVLTTDYKPVMPVILNGVAASVNLNGNKVLAPVFAESKGQVLKGDSDSYAFWVKEGAELTIEGEGEVVAQEAVYSMAVWANGGKVTIKGGKFYNNGDNSDLIYASNGSQVEIFGGEFYANENKGAEGTKNEHPALNIKDADRANTSIKVYGGKFYGFDPAKNVSEGPDTNFVAEGYVSVEVEPNVWEVRKAE